MKALDIAKYFIWCSNQDKKVITNKKLQKLLYYAQAWNLVLRSKPLFDDKVEAWVHGPAIYSVYQKYRMWGYHPISENVKPEEIKDMPSKDILDQVWSIYGKFDGDYLEQLTHSEIPWQKAREKMETAEDVSGTITNEEMVDYFTNLLLK